jgi:hypothetical protein
MEYDEAYAYFLNRMEELHHYIIPLYKRNHLNKIFEYVGSSVLCNFYGLKVLFTAAHVLEETQPEKPYLAYSEDRFMELPSNEIRVIRENDIDIGIAILAIDLPLYLSVDSLKFGSFCSDEKFQHILVGCPGSGTRHSDRNTQKTKIQGYVTSASEESEYLRLNVNKKEKFIVKFNKEKVYKENMKQFTFPNPNGMSGGGIFQFDENNAGKFELVGIMTDWDPHRKNAIIAARIDNIMNKYFTVEKKI